MESRIGLKPPKEPQPNTYWRRHADAVYIKKSIPSFVYVLSVKVGYKKMGFKDVTVKIVGGVDYATRRLDTPIQQYLLQHKEFINTYHKIEEDILSEELGLEILASL